jgi:sugar phosphate isomerase/epimerase
MKKLTLCLLSVFALMAASCDNANTPKEGTESTEEMTADYDISLAQWSLNKSFFGERPPWPEYNRLLQESPDSLYNGVLHPDDFPSIAKEMGFNTIELVNTFYYGKTDNMDYWKTFKAQCDKEGVQVGLIMCDALGNLGDADDEARNKAVENHYAWVDIAEFLGAHTIRVNAAGSGSAAEVAENAVKGLSKLGEYGAKKGINVVVENHGGYSSDGSWLSAVMKEVGMDNVGTLPDVGNFCVENGPDGCVKEYDRYKGMQELMPYAKGVSIKTHNFDADGSESDIDYERIMQIVKDSGFKGTLGIEYEGSDLTEKEGIMKTNAMLEGLLAMK